jgi:hypothetical protein
MCSALPCSIETVRNEPLAASTKVEVNRCLHGYAMLWAGEQARAGTPQPF